MTDAASLLPLVESLAREAGAVHLRHFRKLATIERKSRIDLVTIADREAEDLLAARLRARFPEHALLLEESGLHGAAESEYTWVIDPLDGTTNFAHGLRLFAVSIALVHRGQPILGAIHAPALDELYIASLGGEAFLNGQRLRVSSAAQLDDALLVTGFPYDRKRMLDPLMGMFRTALAHTQGVLRLGAAALDFAAVAAGHLDAFYEYNLKPWDVAAGMLLLSEAGGRTTDFRGGEYDLFHPVTTLATNGHLHDAVQRTITEPAAAEIERVLRER